MDFAKLCRNSVKRLSKSERTQIEVQAITDFSSTSQLLKERLTTVFISRLSDLPEDGSNRISNSSAKHVLFLEDLPVEAMASRLPQLDIRSSGRLHVATNRSSEGIEELVYRLLRGITTPNGPQSIVDAWIESEQLVLLSACFKRLTIPVAKLERILGTNKSKIKTFEFDEDGRFLYWPHADAHLGWEQLRQLINPAAAFAAKQASADFWKRYGAAIRSFRDEKSLKQSDIAGVTERNLRRVEHGELPASATMFTSLANAHSMPIESYLEEIASRVSD